MSGWDAGGEMRNLGEFPEIVWADAGQEVDVIRIVEGLDFVLASRHGFVRVHGVLQAEAQNEMFGQGQSPRLHRMRLAEMHIFDMTVVVERDLVAGGTRDAQFFDVPHDPGLEFGISPMPFIIFGHRGSVWHGRLEPAAVRAIGVVIVLMVVSGMMSSIDSVSIA
jgi:hypothetical protein